MMGSQFILYPCCTSENSIAIIQVKSAKNSIAIVQVDPEVRGQSLKPVHMSHCISVKWGRVRGCEEWLSYHIGILYGSGDQCLEGGPW